MERTALGERRREVTRKEDILRGIGLDKNGSGTGKSNLYVIRIVFYTEQ
jgi:hypothetical protein